MIENVHLQLPTGAAADYRTRATLRMALRQTSAAYLVHVCKDIPSHDILEMLAFDFDPMFEAHFVLGRLVDMIAYAARLEEHLTSAQTEDDIPF